MILQMISLNDSSSTEKQPSIYTFLQTTTIESLDIRETLSFIGLQVNLHCTSMLAPLHSGAKFEIRKVVSEIFQAEKRFLALQ